MTDTSKRLLEKAAFDEAWFWDYAKDVCRDKKYETERVGLKLIEHIGKLQPLITALIEDREALLGALGESLSCMESHIYRAAKKAIADSEARMKKIVEGT